MRLAISTISRKSLNHYNNNLFFIFFTHLTLIKVVKTILIRATTMSWRREGSKTYVTAVVCVEWFVTGSWARSVCTYHVICELPAKVAAAFTQPMVDHIYDHLSQLVRSGPQVIHGPPAGCFDLCAGVGVCATCSQVFHSSDSFSSINRTIQLQKSHRKWFQNGLFLKMPSQIFRFRC